jgi:hypothetical protein
MRCFSSEQEIHSNVKIQYFLFFLFLILQGQIIYFLASFRTIIIISKNDKWLFPYDILTQ